ncbi:hypothetical protein [Bradyrhizobium sp. URHC0002]
MRPTTAINDNVFNINALIHPGTVFNDPRDVVSHPTLTLAEKRAILASWASVIASTASPGIRREADPFGCGPPSVYLRLSAKSTVRRVPSTPRIRTRYYELWKMPGASSENTPRQARMTPRVQCTGSSPSSIEMRLSTLSIE